MEDDQVTIHWQGVIRIIMLSWGSHSDNYSSVRGGVSHLANYTLVGESFR